MAPKVEKIELFSRWTGFAVPSSKASRYQIIRIGGAYMGCNPMDGEERDIEPDKIEELLRQFISARNPENVNRSGEIDWTDDYPAFLIKIYLDGQIIYSAFSEAQQDGMLPWMVSQEWGHSGYNSYNKELSAAIAALLPVGFLNKDRIERISLKPGVPLDDSINFFSHQEKESENDPLFVLPPNPPLDIDRLAKLIKEKTNVRTKNRLEQTGLHLAAASGEEKAVFAWIKAGADVNAMDMHGVSVLMYAVAWPGIMKALLTAGANANHADVDGGTVLMHALTQDVRADVRKEVVEILLAFGAEVKVQDSKGNTALTCAKILMKQMIEEREIDRAFSEYRLGGVAEKKDCGDHEMMTCESLIERLKKADA